MKKTYVSFSTTKIYWCLFFALLLRFFWFLIVQVDPVSDGAMYHDFAARIAKGLGYSYPDGKLTVYWAVGASACYALVNLLFGFSNVPIAFANMFTGLGVIYLTYLIAERYFSESTAIRAAWVAAVWPVLIQFTTVYASELLFMFFLLAAVYVWGGREGSRVIRAIAWGTLLCIAAYIRPTATPLFLALPLVGLLSNRDWRGALLSVCVAVATAAVLFAPWMLRNQAEFGTPVLVSANFGSNLWMGNNPKSDGAYMDLPDIAFTSEIERDLYFKKEAIDFIKANPLAYAKLAVKRFVVTYDRETIGVAWNEPALKRLGGERGLWLLKLISSAFWWLAAASALVGLVWALWRGAIGVFNPLLVVSGFFFVVPILTVGQDRYHLPLDPFLAIFAGYAMHSAWLLYKGDRT